MTRARQWHARDSPPGRSTLISRSARYDVVPCVNPSRCSVLDDKVDEQLAFGSRPGTRIGLGSGLGLVFDLKLGFEIGFDVV